MRTSFDPGFPARSTTHLFGGFVDDSMFEHGCVWRLIDMSSLDLSRCVACEELTRYVYDLWHDVEGGIIERDDGGDSGRGILGGLSARLTSHRPWEQKRRYPLVSFPGPPVSTRRLLMPIIAFGAR
jgi:hypothetical protein